MKYNKKHQQKKRFKAVGEEEVAALYKEDIGTQGIKTAHNGPILSGPEAFKFQVSLSGDELRRRLKRKARFGCLEASESAATKPEENQDLEAEERLLMPLTSVRSSQVAMSWKRPKKKKNSTPNVYTERFVGTCEDLEKPYLRLTTFPKPEQIRPQEVLVKSLAHIKAKYFQNEDFEWANEQLKSVRQDITVQRLRDKFVLEVYETHARILLEHGDLNEFNQCQTVIRYLTTTGCLDGGDFALDCDSDLNFKMDTTGEVDVAQSDESADEFCAYGILYSLVQNSQCDLAQGLVRARACIQQVEEHSQKKNSPSKNPSYERGASSRHALNVMKAVIHNDYRTFFKLYESAPNMSAYLMDFLVKRMREAAFQRVIAAYRPTVSVEQFREALYFKDLEETRSFLKKSGAVFVEECTAEPPFWVDCKKSICRS